MAHAIKSNFTSFAEALKFAWNVIKLQCRLLTESVVNFTFKKVDGTIRDAVGTLETVPMPKGGFKKSNFAILNYFDLQQQDWRCCKIENLLF